jgi:hypothetical protein
MTQIIVLELFTFRADKVIIDHVDVKLNNGVVVRVNENECFVEATQPRGIPLTVSVHLQKLPRFCFPVKVGDTIKYELAKAPGAPSAKSAVIVNLAERSIEEVLKFFEDSAESFSTRNVDQVLDEILRSKN